MADLQTIARRYDSTVWLAVGVLGVLVFLVGAYTPALSTVPYGGYLSLGLAFAGGAIALLGFSAWYEQRQYEKVHPRRPPLSQGARELTIAPSFEVYDPRSEGGPRPVPSEPSDEPD